MASVKNRSKSQKSTSKSKSKHKYTTTSMKKDKIAAMLLSKEDIIKNPLSSEEKVALFLQNGHLMKDKFMKKSPMVNGKIDKDALPLLTKAKLVSKSGRVKNKNKDKLSILDDILKSELMINDRSDPKKSKHQEYPIYHESENNNCGGVSDQNKSESEKSSVSSTPQKVTNSKSKTKQKKKCINKKVSKEKQSDSGAVNKQVKMKMVTLSNGVVLTLSLFECDYCHKTFSNKSSLRRHMYMHLDLKPYFCPQCHTKFRQRGNLRLHMKRKHTDEGNKTYECNQCGKIFLLEENLNLHLQSHVKSENSYRCVYCDKRFSHNVLLTQHEKQHMISGRFQCSMCNMSYETRARLSLHVKGHLNIKDYICQYCGKDFLRPNSLTRHLEISHGGYRIQCPVCKKNLKGHLTEHMRTHEKKRPHECPDCGQRFTQSTQLNVHRRGHSGARPYVCLICDQPFTHSNALMLHIRRHTGEKPFACAMCPLLFSQLPHMKAHMKKIHGKDKAYRCSKCNSFFKLKSQLELHSKSCAVGEKELSFEEKIQASVETEEVESAMNISRMRFLLALLLTIIATKDKLKYLGFNKRLIDDVLVGSLEAMGQQPCRDESLSPVKRLKTNIQILLNVTVPEDKMAVFRLENKSTEELLVLLTDEKKKK